MSFSPILSPSPSVSLFGFLFVSLSVCPSVVHSTILLSLSISYTLSCSFFLYQPFLLQLPTGTGTLFLGFPPQSAPSSRSKLPQRLRLVVKSLPTLSRADTQASGLDGTPLPPLCSNLLTFQMRTPRSREQRTLSHCHTASLSQSWELNPGFPTPCPMFFSLWHPQRQTGGHVVGDHGVFVE